MSEILIIDMSHHQDPGLIDYDELASQIDGAILRTAYGNKSDETFNVHYNELHSRKVPLGAYQFLTEYMSVESQVEAMKSVITGKELPLGLWLDVELEAGADPLTRQTVHSFIQQAELVMKELGIYTANWCWEPIMKGVYYTNKKLWVSNFTTATKPIMPDGWTSWWLWQYKSTGYLDGYVKNLDFDRFYGTELEFMDWIGKEPPEPTKPLEHLYYPCDQKWSITQLFGANPAYYPTSKGHNGIDFGTPVGEPVYAGWNGVVEVAREDTNGYGRHIRIRHSHGVTIYGHLSKVLVKVGDLVTAKQMIGLSGGNTDDPYCGYSTGPHLHFEYRWDIPAPQVPGGYVYNAVDPLPMLIAHEEEEMLYQVKVICGGLNVRTGPGTNYGVLYVVHNGDILNVFEERSGWLRIGVGKWCSGYKDYVQKISSELSLEEKVEKLWEAHLELH